MNAMVARGLRRIVDVLQRSLFDDDLPFAAAPVAGPATSQAPTEHTTSPPTPVRTGKPAFESAREFVHPRATREIVLDGRRVAFALKRSRRRSIGFIVGLEGLVVSAPKWVTLRDVDAALREKSAWILRQAASSSASRRGASKRRAWSGRTARRCNTSASRSASSSMRSTASLAAKSSSMPKAKSCAGSTTRPSTPALDPCAVCTSACRQVPVPTGCAMPCRAGCSARRGCCSKRAAPISPSASACAYRVSRCRRRPRAGAAPAPVARCACIGASFTSRWPRSTTSSPTKLAHLREMNHGPRFWNVVRSVVPDYESARRRLGSEVLAAFD